MTPNLAQAVDPILLHVLNLLDRIGNNEQPSAPDEQMRIRVLLDQAEAIVGAGREWDLAKYALVSWIDEVLVDAPWDGSDWWSNQVLEVELFKTRLCNEQFYVRAQEASTLSNRDALELYYVCVILGFRGLYRDPNLAGMLVETHGLPADVETWAKQVSMSIRLGQGRPALNTSGRELQTASPLRTKAVVVWPWLVAVMLLACNLIGYWFWTKGQ